MLGIYSIIFSLPLTFLGFCRMNMSQSSFTSGSYKITALFKERTVYFRAAVKLPDTRRTEIYGYNVRRGRSGAHERAYSQAPAANGGSRNLKCVRL